MLIISQTIAEHLNGTALESFWANISYLLCVVVTQPLYTTISDTFGRKPPLYFAFLLFAVGSLAFALAQNMTTIIAGRVLQGLGGGGLDLLGEIIVADITTLQERSLYLGLMALPIALGTILGPTMGALLSSFVSWRWIGWINLPLLGVAFPLVLFFLRTRPIDTALRANMKRLDWGGMFFSVVGITAFVVPLSWADALYPWESWRTIVPLMIGVALLVALGFYEARSQNPVIPHRLFASHTAKSTLLGNFMYGAILFTVLQYLPLFYQAVELQTVIGSAVTLLPTSIACVIAAAGAVILVGVVGKGYVWTIRLFWVELTLGTGLLALLKSGSSRSMLLGLPVIWSAGVGALMRLLHLPMQASVPSVDDTGLAIGLLLTFRLLGGLVGLAVGSTLFNSIFGSAIADIQNLPGSLAVLRDGKQAIGYVPELRKLEVASEVLNPVLHAYAEAMSAIIYAMTAFGFVGFLSSIFTFEHTLQKTDLGRQRFDDSDQS
jgi:multidrug resistance protein